MKRLILGAAVVLTLLGGATAARADGFSLDVGVKQVNGGLFVSSVTPGGDGDTLGIRVGDVIYGVNGYTVATADDLRAAVSSSPADPNNPGYASIAVDVHRNATGQNWELTGTLEWEYYLQPALKGSYGKASSKPVGAHIVKSRGQHAR